MARKSADPSEPPKASFEVKTGNATDLLEERVAALEVLIATMQVSPVAEGHALVRCSICSAFASRQHRFEHPHSATCYQPSCDDCELRHPLAKHGASVVTTEPIPNYPEACVELGRKINQARKAVVARFAR